MASAIHLHVERVLAGEVDADGRPIISIKEYMERVQGPDFPTGAKIHGIDGIEDMYRTGRDASTFAPAVRSSKTVVHPRSWSMKSRISEESSNARTHR